MDWLLHSSQKQENWFLAWMWYPIVLCFIITVANAITP